MPICDGITSQRHPEAIGTQYLYCISYSDAKFLNLNITKNDSFFMFSMFVLSTLLPHTSIFYVIQSFEFCIYLFLKKQCMFLGLQKCDFQDFGFLDLQGVQLRMFCSFFVWVSLQTCAIQGPFNIFRFGDQKWVI